MKSRVKLEHKNGTWPGAHQKRCGRTCPTPFCSVVLASRWALGERVVQSGVAAGRWASGIEGHEEVVVVRGWGGGRRVFFL